jgi:hypothetical protein
MIGALQPTGDHPMTYTVVIYNHYLRCPSAVVGPFNTKAEAQAWMEEKDQKLTKDEAMAIHSLIDKDLILN